MENSTEKQRIFSGIQPSGEIHIGNYLGAIRNWISLTESYDCIFCLVDYHALTGPGDPKQMPDRVFEAAVALISCGLDPETCTLFVQSHVPEHTELCWLFNAVTPLGSLFRMTQFKDKSRGALRRQVESDRASAKDINRVAQQLRKLVHGVHDRMKKIDTSAQGLKGKPKSMLDPIRAANDQLGELMQFLQVGLGINEANAGLVDYPVLQAADVLLYKATGVPVGEDQIQHIELCREIADRFNKHVGVEIFPEAQALISQIPKILGTDGKAKMSKSLGNHIGVLWTEEQIWDQLRTAYTDPEKLRKGDPGRPELCNIFTIHGGFTDQSKRDEIDEECKKGTLGCVDCKQVLLKSMIQDLAPKRERSMELIAHPDQVRDILQKGATRCRTIAEQTLSEARQAMGLRGGQCDPE